MNKLVPAIIAILRPRQWLKNLALFAALFFSGHLFDGRSFLLTCWGFAAFCLLSSSSYVVNDIIDLPADREHPFKKNRPLAKGLIRINTAVTLAIILALTGLVVSWFLAAQFLIIGTGFILLRYANTLKLRFIPIIDILSIAAGYILRVYAGIVVTGLFIPVWLMLAIFSLSLLIAIGKRRAEFTLLQDQYGDEAPESLVVYSEKMLNTYVAMFATATFITYAYYTFLLNPAVPGFFITQPGPGAMMLERKWMMASIPFVLYGIMRFLQLVYEERRGTLEKIITSDKPLLTTGCLWLFTTFFVIYGIGG